MQPLMRNQASIATLGFLEKSYPRGLACGWPCVCRRGGQPEPSPVASLGQVWGSGHQQRADECARLTEDPDSASGAGGVPLQWVQWGWNWRRGLLVKGRSVFFGMQWRNPERFERPGLFTWQELTVVQQVLVFSCARVCGDKTDGLFGWRSDSSVVLLLSV